MQPTILLVDDQPENLTVLAGLLETHYHIKVAKTGERALRAAVSEPRPDLILLDIMMPGMDGYSVLQHLRKLTQLDIPVIFVTTRDAELDEEYGLRLGAVDYITKPLKPSVVLARVQTHLENKQARDQLRNQLDQLAIVFKHSREGIMITSADGTIIDVNDAFTRITGYNRGEILGLNPRVLSSGRQSAGFYAEMWKRIQEEGQWSGEIWDRRKDGEVYTKRLSIIALRNGSGLIQRYIGLFTDITTQQEHQNQLNQVAHYDALTGLPNRTLLADRLRQAMAQSHLHQQLLAVANIDLDGFKLINDEHGAAAGDHLLTVIADRMARTLHESDTLARIGGDEFVVVLSNQANLQSSMVWMQQLLDAVAQPVEYDGNPLQVSCSIGLAVCSGNNDIDADQLLREADQAMYRAKLMGKNRYFVFNPEQDRNIRDHHENLQRIRQALNNREFVLFYQPKVNMKTGEVYGAEALIRWQHPEQGLLAPIMFLPEIEQDSLSIELGEWVIDTALSQIAVWQRQGLNLIVSVNIAAIHLQQANFAERLQVLLDQYREVSPSLLELEVLETSALDDISHVSAIIDVCNNLGVGFALDDFGTGYSSLAYLKRLPANILKIDQGFVREMLTNPDDLTILEGIIGLATAFRRQVIAEGVETVEHGRELLMLGCELGQGYGIARPMPATKVPEWIGNWQLPATWHNRAAVRREQLPILFAKVELRALVLALANHIEQDGHAPDIGGFCRFGVWLETASKVGTDGGKHLDRIRQPYNKMLDLAMQLLALKQQNQHAAVSGLTQLNELRDQLLPLMDTLID